MSLKASSILHEKFRTASSGDRKKIQSVYRQISYWVNNFKNFGDAEYNLMLEYFDDKISRLHIKDPTIKTYLKNAVQTKLKQRKR